MSSRVVDASALMHALVGRSEQAQALRGRPGTTQCHAPHLVDAELGSVLQREVARGSVTPTRAQTALRAAEDVVDVRYAHAHAGALAELAWTWRDNLSCSNALHVALAVRLDVALVTADGRLGRAPRLACAVEVLDLG